jgi:hypothetical protein
VKGSGLVVEAAQPCVISGDPQGLLAISFDAVAAIVRDRSGLPWPVKVVGKLFGFKIQEVLSV